MNKILIHTLMILSAIGSAYGEDAKDEIPVALSGKAETVLKDMDRKVLGIQTQMNKVYADSIKLLENEKVEVTKKGNLEMALGIVKKIEELKKMMVLPAYCGIKPEVSIESKLLGKWNASAIGWSAIVTFNENKTVTESGNRDVAKFKIDNNKIFVTFENGYVNTYVMDPSGVKMTGDNGRGTILSASKIK